MHIVFVTTELATSHNSTGGLASFTANMARIFYQHGHDVTIVAATTKEENLEFDTGISLVTSHVEMERWKSMDRKAGILVHFCRDDKDEIRKMLLCLYKSRQVRQAIDEIHRRKSIDLVHYCNLSALALRADRRIPYCVRLSSFLNVYRGANTRDGSVAFSDNRRSCKDKLIDYVVSRSGYVISPSHLLAEVCAENLYIQATVLESPYVVDARQMDDSVYHAWGMQDKKYILFFGTLKYAKGIQVVANLVYELLDRYPDISLVLAGNVTVVEDKEGNPIKADELVIRNAGEYADRVIYAGALPREQLYPFIQNAVLCLLPSRIENLANACVEAMAMGRIVVGTNGASFEQLIEDRVSGFLCERDNPASYLQAIDEALQMSDQERKRMSQAAVETTKRLAPDKVYENYLAYYQKVIREWQRH